jgi:hypothetical protein
MKEAFTLVLELAEVAADGTETAIPAVNVAERIQLRLVQGIAGRMLYILGAEKQRIRRTARIVAASRSLSTAAGNALDRTGADLGVPRLDGPLVYDAVRKEIVVQAWPNGGGEPDSLYRRRLRIFRPLLVPTTTRLRELLNGPDSGANTGLLGKTSAADTFGITDRFDLITGDNPFGVAVHFIAVGGATQRTNFFRHLRTARLVWPADSVAANTAHAARFLPSTKKQAVNDQRARLRQSFQFADDAAIAPVLAASLDRLGKCLRALGGQAAWSVLRAQDTAGGSRYEAGLGIDLKPLTDAQLKDLATRLAARVPTKDAELEGLMSQLKSKSPADDPVGVWLFAPCGIQTVHRLNADRLYLSHLPTFGMKITAADTLDVGQTTSLEAKYEAPGTPESNAVLEAGLAAAAKAWTDGGGAAWTVLDDATARTAWNTLPDRPASFPAFAVFKAAGLPAVEKVAAAVAALKGVPNELLDTLRLPAALAQSVVLGQPAAADSLGKLVNLLKANGLTSAVPFVTPTNEVLLVVGVIGLPRVGMNLNEQRATGFRWYAVPLAGLGGRIKPVGSRSTFAGTGAGVTAVIALGYVRRGGTDPYEYRVQLPDAATRLTLPQYEFLMNLLDATFPLGVEVNTFAIRSRGVNLTGDAAAEPLPPSIAQSFRPYHRRRHLGDPSGQT